MLFWVRVMRNYTIIYNMCVSLYIYVCLWGKCMCVCVFSPAWLADIPEPHSLFGVGCGQQPRFRRVEHHAVERWGVACQTEGFWNTQQSLALSHMGYQPETLEQIRHSMFCVVSFQRPLTATHVHTCVANTISNVFLFVTTTNSYLLTYFAIFLFSLNQLVKGLQGLLWIIRKAGDWHWYYVR